MQFIAHLTDGRHVTEQDIISLGVSRPFAIVQELEREGALAAFSVALPNVTATVDLTTGPLTIGGEVVSCERPAEPLRLIYYKRMSADLGSFDAVMEFVAIGWQATVAGKNVRFGVRLYPGVKHFIVGEDI